MIDYAAVSRQLQDTLHLSLPPIAVCLADHAPEGIGRPTHPVAAGCVFWQDASRGPILTVADDHGLCAVGVHTHNLADPPASYGSELSDVLKVMADLDYVRPEEVARIPVLSRKVPYVIYSPLAESPLPPDAVLLFAHSRQGLVITEAVQQVEPETPPALGRPACAIVPQVVNTQQAALSMGCCGARAYLDTLTDDVALWAFPGRKVSEYAARISALAKANETLGVFHRMRRQEVEGGGKPSYRESLSRMNG